MRQGSVTILNKGKLHTMPVLSNNIKLNGPKSKQLQVHVSLIWLSDSDFDSASDSDSASDFDSASDSD